MTTELIAQIESLKKKAAGFTVLYVEDEVELRKKISTFFRKIFPLVDVAANGVQGLESYLNGHYDIVITDILMPKMNGLEMIHKIRNVNGKQEIIIISAYTDPEYLTESIQLEVSGYIIKPIVLEQIVHVLEHSLEKLDAFRQNEMYKKQLKSMVDERTKEVVELQKLQTANYEHAIHALITMMEGRDTYTSGHSERVATYSQKIAKAMGLPQQECDIIYQAGILHDIGKIITPDAILLKPGRLNDQEYLLIKEHVSAGYNFLSEVPMYKDIADIVNAHHEHIDGSGYPNAIKSEEIPLLARIMGVADAFDAMTTNRIYKTKKPVIEAVEELKSLSGIWYDPKVIKVAVDVLKAIDINEVVSQVPNTHIDDERFAYFFKDPLTQLYNASYLDFILQRNRDEQNFICLHLLYINKFSAYNQRHGWSEGDILLRKFSTYLQSLFPNSKIFRIFGDDFVILHPVHQDLDSDALNTLPLLKDNELSCTHKHLDMQKTTIGSLKELKELI
jgi:putative nucleotidyltransferase with HDIG domain